MITLVLKRVLIVAAAMLNKLPVHRMPGMLMRAQLKNEMKPRRK